MKKQRKQFLESKTDFTGTIYCDTCKENTTFKLPIASEKWIKLTKAFQKLHKIKGCNHNQ